MEGGGDAGLIGVTSGGRRCRASMGIQAKRDKLRPKRQVGLGASFCHRGSIAGYCHSSDGSGRFARARAATAEATSSGTTIAPAGSGDWLQVRVAAAEAALLGTATAPARAGGWLGREMSSEKRRREEQSKRKCGSGK